MLALASRVYPSTIWSFNISSNAQGGTPCTMSGSGPGTASCLSTGAGVGASASGYASATLTDTSLQLTVNGYLAARGSAVASITHDDLYSVPVNGQDSA